jgi:hypothetical protein
MIMEYGGYGPGFGTGYGSGYFNYPSGNYGNYGFYG